MRTVVEYLRSRGRSLEMRAAWICLALAACKGRSESPAVVPAPAAVVPADAARSPDRAPPDAAPADPTVVDAAVAAAPSGCSNATAFAIAKRLGARWHSAATTPVDPADGDAPGHVRLDGENTAWLDVHCVAVTEAAPGYFIDAWDNRFVGDNRIQVRHRLIVPRAGTADLASAKDVETPESGGRLDDHEYSFAALDLDGDGRDEILVTDAFEHHGLASSTSYQILAVHGATLALAPGTLVAESGGSQWPQCEGTVAPERAGAATHLVLTAAGGADCPSPGRHTWALVGGALAEIDAAGKPIPKPKSSR
jgi:hypothetical protein